MTGTMVLAMVIVVGAGTEADVSVTLLTVRHSPQRSQLRQRGLRWTQLLEVSVHSEPAWRQNQQDLEKPEGSCPHHRVSKQREGRSQWGRPLPGHAPRDCHFRPGPVSSQQVSCRALDSSHLHKPRPRH